MDAREIDPLRAFEYPAAIFALNITCFVLIWKTIGLFWMPWGLEDRFFEVFTAGYYPRDMERHESAYNLFFLAVYGFLGTAAQVASIRLAQLRRAKSSSPGIYRYLFCGFHLLIAAYHVLFVFGYVQGKMILDGLPAWQMIATQVLYVMTLLMSIESLFVRPNVFFRRKVCLDVVSACNLLPFLIYWGFAICGFYSAAANKMVSYAFFLVIPLAVMWIEWVASIATDRQPSEM